MLDQREWTQIFTMVVGSPGYRMNGRVYVDMQKVLEFIATYCTAVPTITIHENHATSNWPTPTR